MSHKGKLKYSSKFNSWYILEENGVLHKLSNNDLLDAALILSGYYHLCAINIAEEVVSFTNTNFSLHRCYDYDIKFYLSCRSHDDIFSEFDVPF